MQIKFELRHIAGIAAGLFILGLDFYLFFSPMTRWFKPLIVISLLTIGLQFFIDFLNENKRQKEIELKFLEFVRNLVGTVKSGTPVPQSIINISKEDYGALNPHVKKLAHQIEWGIPTREALSIFGIDTKNIVIKRSIAIVVEAEKSGGNIEDVLQSVTDSVLQVKKLKEERKSSTFSQVLQGYIVFFVFIVIMLVLQLKLLPGLTQMGTTLLQGFGTSLTGLPETNEQSIKDFGSIFLNLILVQGFFAGLLIGKFSEGNITSGIKHSVILIVTAYIVITTVRGF